MPDNLSNGDNIYVKLMTDAIREVASLSTKVELISKEQERQNNKLDAVILSQTRIEGSMGNIAQRLENLEDKVSDHETRLRIMEPKIALPAENARQIELLKADNVKQIEALKLENDAQEAAINALKNDIFRVIVVGGVVIFVIQFAITTFLSPLLQSALGIVH